MTLPPLNTSLTAQISNSIARIRPHDALEAQHQQDALDWIASGENIFRIKKPDVPRMHLVSYFVVIDPYQPSVLLEDHIKAQLWLPPGGHVEFNEHPKATVIREAKEELNLRATFLHNYDRPLFITINQTGGLTPGHTDVSLWYLLRARAHDFFQFDKGEFNDVQWFGLDEILATDPVIFDAHMHRFTAKLKNFLAT